MDEALVAARLIHFAAAMAGFGGAAFRLYALGGVTAGGEAAALTSFDRWHVRLLRASALVMLFSALAIAPFTAGQMAGAAGTALPTGGLAWSRKACARAAGPATIRAISAARTAAMILRIFTTPRSVCQSFAGTDRPDRREIARRRQNPVPMPC